MPPAPIWLDTNEVHRGPNSGSSKFWEFNFQAILRNGFPSSVLLKPLTVRRVISVVERMYALSVITHNVRYYVRRIYA